ncbi:MULTISPECIES: thioesterase family protein [Weeksella]|uniref:acyl-CoA thioesterase n=1 Tax=Weeksella TaxID=1013 RepID=UPI0008A4934E|nr:MULTISPECIES: thioesterase family protein [Weeksella]MDK7374569.1 thioesterase family protein [Weeksella virosa]OFM83110.1 thioesterase [Weeksella sp. HMSC059D05]
MPRIKVEVAENPIFQTMIPVRITDLNYGNHLGNDSLLSIIHEARVQFLYSLGYSEQNFAGVGLIMADVAIEYKSQGYYADQLKVSIGVKDISRVGFDITYSITKSENGREIIVAKAKTGMVTFDYSLNKVIELPATFLEKLP